MQHPTPNLDQAVIFRRELHQHPELSGKEVETAARVAAFLDNYRPDKILTGLGGTGVAAIFSGKNSEGPTVLFRAELDALPIQEENKILPYSSVTTGISHKCGHDGHMAILAGLAMLLHHLPLSRGKVILLFQPAEETGQGAWGVAEDRRFKELNPDYVFALHNLPGFAEHQVVLRDHTFAAASTGMIVEFLGKSSHAAEPENGLNPGQAMAELILSLNNIMLQQFTDLTLLTVVHARLGEVAFGTNPGFATVMATLRAFQQTDFELLKGHAAQAAKDIADKYKLACDIRFVEEFPATVNHEQAVGLVRKVVRQMELEVHEAVQPFKWSEDFGHFTARYNGALFGLGAGKEQAQLHHAHYDFPDAIIPTGARLFYNIAAEIMNP